MLTRRSAPSVRTLWGGTVRSSGRAASTGQFGASRSPASAESTPSGSALTQRESPSSRAVVTERFSSWRKRRPIFAGSSFGSKSCVMPKVVIIRMVSSPLSSCGRRSSRMR